MSFRKIFVEKLIFIIKVIKITPDKMKKTIKLNENDLHNIVKDTVKKVIKEAHIIDRQFGMNSGAGSFETAIVNAWVAADNGNKKRLQDAFPEFFPKEQMFGNDEEPFDFREFPTRDSYNEFYKGWQNRHQK